MCLTPINLKKEKVIQKLKDTYHMQQVPCGKCLECLKLRINSWFVRLMAQRDISDSALFITLTYDEENLPFSENGLMCLDYKDTQDFWKRLRKVNNSKKPIRYFLVGEYGSKLHRPHYHAIVFNVTNSDLIDKAWQKGQIHVAPMNEATTYYTLKYALKRATKWKKSDPYDDRSMEKALMSRGLGLNFLTEDMVRYYQEDVSRPVTMKGNKKLPLPRYYRDRLFTDAQKSARNKMLLPHNEKRYDKLSDKLFPQRVTKMLSDAEEKSSQTD